MNRSSTGIMALKLSLHDRVLGYLSHSSLGRNQLVFTEAYRQDPARPTFTLTTHPNFPGSATLLTEAWSRQQKLHPVLSNLLPEGSLRDYLAQSLKVHSDNEFYLLSYLGHDLPGALVARAIPPEAIPDNLLQTGYGAAHAIAVDPAYQSHAFSLAGVQMKFSMKQEDARYTLSASEKFGDWIIKTPSTRHPFVPQNEFTAMTLAKLAGIPTPDFKLVSLDKLEGLPAISLPDEQEAFAIRRFDRSDQARIHAEDFAQIFMKFAHEKYQFGNYEMIGKILYQYSASGLSDIQQFASRLLVNALLANGDAHLKNWSVYYPDRIHPRLSPAYDIVTTKAYFPDEQQFALNLGRTKQWYKLNWQHFEAWAKKADLPWRAVQSALKNTLELARSNWPQALSSLPMHEPHKEILRSHWRNLDSAISIQA